MNAEQSLEVKLVPSSETILEPDSTENHQLPALPDAGEVSNEGLGFAGHLTTHWAMPHLPGVAGPS